MSEEKMMRLGQIARKLNVGTATIVESMAKKGFEVENNPNSKISMEQVAMLEKEFKSSALDKEEASHLSIGKRHEPISLEPEAPKQEKAPEPTPAPVHKEEPKPAVIPSTPTPEASTPTPVPEPEQEPEKVSSDPPKLEGIKILGKIDLDKKPAIKSASVPKPHTNKEGNDHRISESKILISQSKGRIKGQVNSKTNPVSLKTGQTPKPKASTTAS